jgi:threonine synthase
LSELNLYYSTNLKSPGVTFREALLKGLAPDGGLYIPSVIPEIREKDLESLGGKSYPEVAAFILGHLLGDEVDKKDLTEICNEIYNFDVPVEKISESNFVARLDQGPTASFKDFAALFMGRIFQYFLNIDNQRITILTATSGDTGSAVANAFYGLDNIRVVILFPWGEVTDLQRKQMTTLNKNIHIVAIDGKFDDCQKLVKTAFMDPSLAGLGLSSANSINIGRLLPQSVYYFRIWSKLTDITGEPVIISVPSGNFGNLAAGLIARRMGLPVRRFIISTNENDEVPGYFLTGEYHIITPSRNCISSAMNVGHPSNLARIVAMYGGVMNEKGEFVKKPDLDSMRKDMFAISVTEDETRKAISECYRMYSTVLEPHGAVAWMGLQKYIQTGKGAGEEDYPKCILETAHPAKFSEEIEKILNVRVDLPESLKKVENGQEEYSSLENDYSRFKDFIKRLY